MEVVLFKVAEPKQKTEHFVLFLAIVGEKGSCLFAFSFYMSVRGSFCISVWRLSGFLRFIPSYAMLREHRIIYLIANTTKYAFDMSYVIKETMMKIAIRE